MARPKAQDCQAVVSATRMLTRDVLEISFKLTSPESITILPGLFLTLKVPRPEGGKPMQRSYSIVSSPARGNELTLLVDTDPNGPGSQYLVGLKVGDEVLFKAPLGTFFLKDPSDRRALFAANVSAVGVCYAVAKSLLEAQPELQVTFIFQAKRATDLFYHQELLELARTYKGFRHIITVAQPAGQWKGMVGSLAQLLPARLGDPATVDVYLAGLGDVVKELRDLCEKAGVPKEHIAVERFSTTTSKDKGDEVDA